MRGTERVLIVDVARADADIIQWGTLEEMKDGIWNTDKYAGAHVNREFEMHLIVFMNCMPNLEKLSKDRWILYEIEK